MSIQDRWPGLCFAKINNFDLLVGYCPNKHLHIFGFHSDIKEENKIVDIDKMMMTITDQCRDCGCEVTNKLTLCWHPGLMGDGAGI